MKDKVSIVLLNYKGLEDTLQCIENLEKIDYDNYEIIIVDNHSEDGSYEILKKRFEHKHVVIEAEVNGGFASGNNLGIKYAVNNGTDFVLLINTDTFVEEDFLKELISCYHRNSTAGIVTSKILYESNRDYIWYAGGEVNLSRFYGYHFGEGERDSSEYNIEKKISFATGCVMLISSKVIKKVGLFCEDYFMYYEDVDYCVKITEAGYNIYYCPSSIVYHKVSASSGGEESPFAVKWNTRNRIIFMDRFKYKVSNINYIKAKFLFYVTRLIKLIQYRLKGSSKKANALKEGMALGRKSIKENK